MAERFACGLLRQAISCALVVGLALCVAPSVASATGSTSSTWSFSVSDVSNSNSSTTGTYGDTVTLLLSDSADTAPMPTGTVTFTAGGAAIAGCSSITLSPNEPARAQCTTTTIPANSQTLGATYSGDSTYATQSRSASFRMQTAPLQLYVRSLTVYYGQSYQNAAGLTGILNSDSISVSSSQFQYTGVSPTVYSTSTTAPVSAGTYVVSLVSYTLSGSATSNYNVTIASGSLVIEPEPLTINSSSIAVSYGATVSPSYTLVGLRGSDAATVTGLTYNYQGTSGTSYGPSSAAPTLPGSYLITPSGGTATFSIGNSSNYDTNFTYGTGTLTIGSGQLAVQATSVNVVAGTSWSPSATLVGLLGSDAATVSAVTYTYQGTNGTSYGPSSVAPTVAGSYLITPSAATISFTSGSSSNYSSTILYRVGSLTITAGQLKVQAASVNVAAGATWSPSATLSGLLSGEAATVTNLTYTYQGTSGTNYGPSSVAPTLPGSYLVTPSSATISFSAGSLAHYNSTIQYSAGTLTIGTGQLKVQATSVNVAPGATWSPSVTLSGLLSGEAATVTNLTYTYQGTNGTTYGPSSIAPTSPGSYLITPSGATISFSAGNLAHYNSTIQYSVGTLMIGTGQLKVQATSVNVAAGATWSPSVALSGLLNGEAATVSALTYTYQGTNGTTYGPSSVAPTSPGSYLITPSGATISFTSGNLAHYNSTIQYLAGNLAIGLSQLTVQATSVNVAAGTTWSPSATLSGLLSGDAATVSALTYTYQGTNGTSYGLSSVAPTSPGSYLITPSGATISFTSGTSSHYNVTTDYLPATLTLVAPGPPITPAPAPSYVTPTGLGAPQSKRTVAGAATLVQVNSTSVSASVVVPQGALPAGTTVSLYLVQSTSAIRVKVPPGQTYVASLIVTWKKAGFKTSTARHAVSFTVSGAAIASGGSLYYFTANSMKLHAVVPASGSVTVRFSVPQVLILLSGLRTQARLTISSTARVSVAKRVALKVLGGSGSGVVHYAVVGGTASGCALKGSSLSAASPGTCEVAATKVGTSVFATATSAPVSVTFVSGSVSQPLPARVSVNFAPHSSTLSLATRRLLTQVSAELSNGASIVIVGYALNDPNLARARAAQVRAFLTRGRSLQVLVLLDTVDSSQRVLVIRT
ncbi:MAG TPA: Ig-like domain-containing protein [Acidimicrobiales bacterium]|nr:Ig-like domain-containing protein [Acidimicrobiales bacterium]